MAETLGPVAAVDTSGYSEELGGRCLLQASADPAGREPAEPAEDEAGRPLRRSFETGALVRALYAEIRAIAASQVAHQWAANSLHPTALANEAVMRILQGVGGERWDSHRHFLGAAAEAMRRVVVDAARRRRALKRGGRLVRHEISSLGLAASDLDTEVLFVNDALDVLGKEDTVAAEIFRLSYFGGLTIKEVSEKLAIPRRSVDRRLAYARAWLACRWTDQPPSSRSECRVGGA
jgi:RNA polymerase sigma factor (TIGR02999 family)